MSDKLYLLLQNAQINEYRAFIHPATVSVKENDFRLQVGVKTRRRAVLSKTARLIS